MASVKFSKGTEEWLMFMDFWNLCQKYWQVEETDEYWDNIIADASEFSEKYKSIPLAIKISVAFLESQNQKSKK